LEQIGERLVTQSGDRASPSRHTAVDWRKSMGGALMHQPTVIGRPDTADSGRPAQPATAATSGARLPSVGLRVVSLGL